MANAQIRITADTSEAERALGRVANGLKDLALAYMGLKGIDAFTQYADQMINLDNRLKSVTKSSEDYAYATDAVKRIARETRSSLGDVGDVYGRLTLALSNYGYSQATVAETSATFIKQVKLSGAAMVEQQSAILQFGQAMTKGVLKWDDLKPLMTAAPGYVKALQEALGMTNAEFMLAAHTGKLTTDKIIDATRTMAEETDKNFSKMKVSFGDTFTLLKNATAEAAGDIDKFLGVSQGFNKFVTFLIDNKGAMIGAIVGIGIAVAGLLIALIPAATAMAVLTGGAAVVGAIAAGTALGYVAQKAGLIGIKAKESKEEINAMNALMKEGENVIIGRTPDQLLAATSMNLELVKIRQQGEAEGQKYQIGILQYEINKKIAEEQEKMVKAGTSLTEQEKASIATAITAKQLGSEKATIDKMMLDLGSQTLTNSILDSNENAIQVELARQKLNLTEETFKARKDELEAAIRLNKESEAFRSITKSNNDELAKANIGVKFVMDPKGLQIELDVLNKRNQYGSAYTKELEAQDRIIQAQIYDLNQQAQVTKILGDLTRAQTPVETAQRGASIFGNTQEGMQKEQQRQQEALKLIKDQGLITDQSYADQKVLIEKNAMDQILAYEQSVATQRMKLGGVTNDAILKSVSDNMVNVKMMQQGGIAGVQGVLGAMDSVMSQMGTTNRKAFEAHKALAVAQAVISTYQAAAMSIAAPPGPPWSFIYVAGAIAAGFAQINAIRSQQYSGKKFGGGVSGSTPYLVGENGPEMFTPASAGQITPTDKMGNQAPVTVNFSITANDTTGFDELITTRKGLITQIIRDAQLERGQRTGY